MRLIQSLCAAFSAFILLAAVFVSAPTLAQGLPSLSDVFAGPTLGEPAEVPLPPTPADPPVAARRAENAELLRVAQRRLEAGNATDSAATQEVAIYKTVEAVLSQQEAVDRQSEELRTRKTELENHLSAIRAGGKKRKSLSFIDFDRLKDEQAAEEARVKLVADRLAAAKTALENAQKSQAKSDSKRRQAEEAFVTGKTGPNAAELSTTLEQARLAANLAAETANLRGKEITRGQLAQEVQQLAVELKHEQVVRASPQVVFAEADLEDQFAQITKQEEAANAFLVAAQNQRQLADERLHEAQKQLDTKGIDRAPLIEQLAALRREVERWSDEADLATQQLERLAQLRMAWDHRYKIATADPQTERHPSSDELKGWQKETKAALDELVNQWSMRVQRMDELRNDLTNVADKAENAQDGAAALISAINQQRAQLDEMLRSQQAALMSIESTRRVYLKLLDELGDNAPLPTKLAANALQQVSDFWNFELGTVGEGNLKKSVTVKNAVAGLIVFIVGWMCSRLLSRVFANRFLKRFRLSKDADAALRSAVYYTLLLIVLLAALNTVKVPLTAFTILGGALAIGVGFGSQALINNFIGGLIMLAERPIRLGERITVGTFDGVVEEVGFRSTKLRTAADHLVTIPNSTLVNDSIENVARRRTIRRLLNLAVNGDTPRAKLAAAVQAIRDILNEKGVRERIHPIVGFEQLPPRVYFNEYNAASFNIQIVYWYAPPDWWDYMEHTERVNFRIMEEFERLGVAFAFPSNTMHLIGDLPHEVTAQISKKNSQPLADRRHVA